MSTLNEEELEEERDKFPFKPELMLPGWCVTDKNGLIKTANSVFKQLFLRQAERKGLSGLNLIDRDAAWISEGSVWDVLFAEESVPAIRCLLTFLREMKLYVNSCVLDIKSKEASIETLVQAVSQKGDELVKELFTSIPGLTSYIDNPVDIPEEGQFLLLGARLNPADGLSMKGLNEIATQGAKHSLGYEFASLVIAAHVRLDWSRGKCEWLGTQPAIHDATAQHNDLHKLKQLQHAENFLQQAGGLYHKLGRQCEYTKERLEYIEQALRYGPGDADELLVRSDPSYLGGLTDITPCQYAADDIASVISLAEQQDKFMAFLRGMRGRILTLSPDLSVQKKGHQLLEEMCADGKKDLVHVQGEADIQNLYRETKDEIVKLHKRSIQELHQSRKDFSSYSDSNCLPGIFDEAQVHLSHYNGFWHSINISQASAFRYIFLEMLWNAVKNSPWHKQIIISFNITNRSQKDELEISIVNDVFLHEDDPATRNIIKKKLSNAYSLLSATGEGGYGLFVVETVVKLGYRGKVFSPDDILRDWDNSDPSVTNGFVLPLDRFAWTYADGDMAFDEKDTDISL